MERRAAAIKDEEMGLLSLVKALKELEDLDLQQIEKLLSLANLVKDLEQEVIAPQEQPPTVQPPQGMPLAQS